MKIFIDWQNVDSFEQFLDIFLSQINMEDWHVRHIDKFSNSLINDSINGVKPPFCIINTNIKNMSESTTAVFESVHAIFAEANAAGRKIRVFNE